MRIGGEAGRRLRIRHREVAKPFGHVHHGSLGVPDRVLDCRLEPAAQIEHEIRRGDRLDLIGRELQVVWLDPRCSEVRHVDAGAPHLLRGLGERIEGRDDGGARGSDEAEEQAAAKTRDNQRRNDD